MKVLLATPLYPPDHGGPATDVASLEKMLPDFGVQTVVYSFGKVRHLPMGIRHIKYAYGLLRRAKGTDCIVSMDTFSVCIPAAFVAKLLGKKFIVRVPGDFVWEQAVQRFGVKDSIEVFQKKRYGFKIEFLRGLQRWAVQKADMSVACSDFLKKIVSTWGVKPEKVMRIYLGMDFNKPVIAPTAVRTLVQEGKIIFSLGRFVPWKGFAMVIDLLTDLPKDWHLVIAGDGPLRSDLEKQARDKGVANRVTFVGVTAHPETLGWYRRADAFVFNTSFESFSFQVLEGMASGTPTITTNIGSIPELLRNGVDGALCEPNDKEAFKKAVLSVEAEPELWKKRTESAKARALEFSLNKSVGLFADEIKKLCA